LAAFSVTRLITPPRPLSKRLLSGPFLVKPPRRDYPDYYDLIKQPIALDDIKKRIMLREYKTLEDVKAALELCFNNALEYNEPGSAIYVDAEALLVRRIDWIYFSDSSLIRSSQKLTKKTYKRLLTGGSDDHGDIEKSKEKSKDNEKDKDKDKDKDKGPSMSRLMKTNLQRLTEITDAKCGTKQSAHYPYSFLLVIVESK
jgi:chromatin structure-remodeling complex subunit RSC4